MAPLRGCVPLLLGALLASGCKDPVPTTGTLVVAINGLPSGSGASLRVTGPAGFFKLVQETTTLESLEPGDYIIRADTLLVLGTKYGVATVRDTISVARGKTETRTFAYAVSSGSLTVLINGLPIGILADVRVKGAGFTTSVVSSTTLNGLAPGPYVIEVDTMTSILGDRFGSGKIRDTVNVVLSATPAAATVNYVLVSGSLTLTVNGLSANVTPANPVTVTGPGGYRVTTNASASLRGLKAGAYTIAANNANGTCPTVYRTSTATQTVDVTIGQITPATVTYAEGQAVAADLNLKIDGLHLIQVSQDFAGNVPMIAGKSALLRVFGTANQCNTAAPKVRVTLGNGQQLVITAQEQSVRLSADESTLLASWNVTLPAAEVQQGLTVVAEIDHDGAIAESNESDNRHPATGTRTISVVQGPTVRLRLVPITVNAAAGALTGNITSANLEAFMDVARRIHPVATHDTDIREPYTASATSLGASGTNWREVLNEISALQASNGERNRYYYGIARVSYTSGVAGIAFLGGRAGMGWDLLPTGSEVLAHELGHNFFRHHAPCGGPDPQSIDPSYPGSGLYSGGGIGVYGYDGVSLRSPAAYTDIMGYCQQKWISDYMYVGMLDYLQNSSQSVATAGSNAEQPSLLIWGRIVNGQPVLEPAFEISARPALPTAPGPHRLTALDENGGELFSLAFSGERVADLPGDNEAFAFVIPRSALRGRALGSLRFTARGRTVTSAASIDVAADPRIVASRPDARRVRLQWDAARFPVVMVRNPVSGQILSFARGGDMTIVADQSELELNFSNRVGSTRRVVRVLR